MFPGTRRVVVEKTIYAYSDDPEEKRCGPCDYIQTDVAGGRYCTLFNKYLGSTKRMVDGKLEHFVFRCLECLDCEKEEPIL